MMMDQVLIVLFVQINAQLVFIVQLIAVLAEEIMEQELELLVFRLVLVPMVYYKFNY